MAFVNEYISDDDIKKYNIEEIDRQFLKTTFRPDWTVDRERETYLRLVASGREEFANEKDFTFLWQGSLLVVRLKENGGGARGGEGWSDYQLVKIDLPEQLIQKEEDILADLRASLTAYKGGGVYSSRTKSKTTFDF